MFLGKMLSFIVTYFAWLVYFVRLILSVRVLLLVVAYFAGVLSVLIIQVRLLSSILEPLSQILSSLSNVALEKSWETLGKSRGYGYGARRSEVESYAPGSKRHKFASQSAGQEQLNSHCSSATGTRTTPAPVNVAVPWSARRTALTKKDRVLKTVLGIVDNLTLENFDVLKDQLITSGINSSDILVGVVSLIFDKAVSEPAVCPLLLNCAFIYTGNSLNFHLKNRMVNL